MVAATTALSPGTAALDPAPLDSRTVGVPTTANTPFTAGPLTLFEKLVDEHPLLAVQNEGFIIHATVPATGTWGFSVTTEWDEVTLF